MTQFSLEFAAAAASTQFSLEFAASSIARLVAFRRKIVDRCRRGVGLRRGVGVIDQGVARRSSPRPAVGGRYD